MHNELEETGDPTPTMKPPVVTLTLTDPDKDALVVAFWDQAWGLLKYAKDELKIATLDDLNPATNALNVISTLKKAVEDKRKEYLRPFKEHVDEVNLAFKKLMEPILAADILTREKIAAYYAEQERKRREQEEVNRLRLLAAEKEEVLKGEVSEPVNLIKVEPVAPKTVNSNLGSAGMTDCWKWEVFDFVALPDEYKIVDSVTLTSMAKKHHDQKQIPGVRFYNEPIVGLRRR